MRSKQFDAAGCSWLSSDEAHAFEGQHHLVNGGRADAEVLLHVGFGRRSAVQAHGEVDKRQILALLRREGFCWATQSYHPIQLLVRASGPQILLAADGGASDEEIGRSIGVGGSTVYRTKRRFVLGNLAAALNEAPRPGSRRKLTGKEEVLLVATACSSAPAGRARWTLELLASEMVRLPTHQRISSVPLLTHDSQIGANLRVCADEEDRADFDRRG